jgi:hypothetical protein
MKKVKCKTEYWFLRCNCERCKREREAMYHNAVNKILWDISSKAISEMYKEKKK